jgi:hypothetical protein
MGMRDPYESLAVPRSATADDIKKSYRLLAKKLHPDANKNDPRAAALFAELNTAHEILGDEVKRRAFDRGEIDAEGRPAPEEVANAVSGLTLSVTGLMVAVAILAGSTLVVRALMPRMEANQQHALFVQPKQPESRLLFPQNISYIAPDAIPLGIRVGGDTSGLALEITGLPSGTTISRGRPLSGGGWRIFATDVSNAVIYLPHGFSGVIDLAVNLRLLDDTVVDRGSLHLEWLQTDPTESAGATAVSENSHDKALATAAPTDQNTIHHAADSRRDYEPIELLVGRSEKLITEGDVEAARILLQPAAEARDAHAALALGSTYDPIMLAILQAHGVAPDASLALDWYKRAQEFGSREAQQRLKVLATSLAVPKKRGVHPPIHIVVSHTAPPRTAAPHLAAPRVAAPPGDPNGVAGNRVAAIPNPSIHADLMRDDANRKLTPLFGVAY